MFLSTLQNPFWRPRSLRSRPRRGRPSRRPPPSRPFLERLEDRNLLSGTQPSSGLLDLALAGRLTAADFKNPPSPIGTTSSTAANVNTDVEGLFHNETTIAVNPTNPLNLIGSANDFQVVVHGGEVYYTQYARARVTFDGGHTWTTYPIPFHGYNITNDPALTFDADGTAYLAALGSVTTPNPFHGNQIGTAPDILVARSTDGGQSWFDPVRVAAGTGTFGEEETENDKSYVIAWGHGNAIVTWTQFHYGPKGDRIDNPILASVTHDGGVSWTAPVQISGSFINDQFSVPTVAADGRIYVAFISYDSASAPLFRPHYEVVQVDPATGQALGSAVEVGLVYNGINDYPFNVFGRQTYQDSEFRSNEAGNLTADPANPLHLAVIWSDMRNNPYPDAELPSLDPYQVQTNSDIIVSQSFDGGLHWSVPAAIASPNDQFQPWGAYDASGHLQIGYYDRSYDPANHEYGYTLASETAPGSLNFTFQQVTTALSDPTQGDAFPIVVTVNSNFPSATTFLGDYSNIAVTPTGVAALWTDLRVPSTLPGFPGSGEDAFFALVDPPALLAPARAPGTVAATLPSQEVGAILAERWAAAGADTAALGSVQVLLTNLSGAELGAASGHTINLDRTTAGWGWFLDPRPHDDSGFSTPGIQGVMRRMPGGDFDVRDPAGLDCIFAAERPRFADLSTDGSVLPALVNLLEQRPGEKAGVSADAWSSEGPSRVLSGSLLLPTSGCPSRHCLGSGRRSA
jgi:hypothetical protein